MSRLFLCVCGFFCFVFFFLTNEHTFELDGGGSSITLRMN